MAHPGQINGDQKGREPLFLLQILHEVDDLRLVRHFQGQNLPARQDEAGPHRQRAADANALAPPARELARLAIHDRGRKTYRSRSSATRSRFFRRSFTGPQT